MGSNRSRAGVPSWGVCVVLRPVCSRSVARKYEPMSDVRLFRQAKEYAIVGNWVACSSCVGRRTPPSAVCDSCADNSLAPISGMWAPGSHVPFRRKVSCALDAAKRREEVFDGYGGRCDPMLLSNDVFPVPPWKVEIRQASPTELRSDLQRVKKHLAPADTSGLENVVGQGDVLW